VEESPLEDSQKKSDIGVKSEVLEDRGKSFQVRSWKKMIAFGKRKVGQKRKTEGRLIAGGG